jgi:energy-coupling factor transport system ATP-binding protein
MSAVSVEDLWWRYHASSEWTLKGVDFEVEKGEFVGIVGPSGAGKTTLCLLLAGVLSKSVKGVCKGKVELFGKDALRTSVKQLSEEVAIVLQDADTQFVTMRVLDEVAFPLENFGLSREEILERVSEALEFVGMSGYEWKHPHELSGGQKQRVAIAAALAKRPKLLILDEATSDLDPLGKREVLSVLRKLREGYDVTAVIVDHNTDDLVEFVDRVIVLEGGRVVADGDPRAVFSRIEQLRTIGIRIPQPTELAFRLGAANGELPLTVEEAVKALTPLKDRLRLLDGEVLENPSRSERLVSFTDVTYVYEDGTVALNGLSLNVWKGEFLAVIGPNGSGKTTMAKLMVSLLKPTSGRVEVMGVDSRALSPTMLFSKVGYVFQNPDYQLVCDTVYDEVAFPLRQLGIDEKVVKERVQWALVSVGLNGLEETPPFFLSKGERQRLALASVLAVKPQLLIIDEPTTGQDERNSRRIAELLVQLNKSGVTIVVITHDLRLVSEYAERVVVLNNGRLVTAGSTRKVFTEHLETLASIGLEPPPVARLMKELVGRPALTVREVMLCERA